VVVGLGIAALAGGVALMRGGTPTPRFGRRTQVTLEPGLEIDPGLSPDGKLLAYVAGTPGEMRLYVRQLGGSAPIAVARDGERFARTPYWSPDGSRLLFLSDRGIELAPALGGTSRLLVAAAGSLVAGPIAPDGRSFAYARNDSLYVQALQGSAPSLLAVAHELHSISWSPDGQWIAYVTGNIHFVWDVSLGSSAPSSIWIVPAAGGAPSPVTDDQALNASPVWAPGGRELLFVSDRDGSRDVYALVLTRAGRPASAPARLSAGLNALGISLSADGTKLAYANFGQTSNVWSLPIPSEGPVSIGQAQPLTTGARSVDFFEISPDGRWLVFDAARSGPHQVFRIPLAGGEPEQLTEDSTSVGAPTYSPDGREIAFHGWRDGHRQVFVMPAVGGTATRVTHTAVEEFLPVWDPRGGRLAVRGSAGGNSWLEVTTRDAGGRWSEPRRLDAALAGAGRSAPCWVSFFTWSPDGSWLATSCWRGGPALVLFSPNGGPGRVLVPDSSAFAPRPAWSGDGRSVYYFADESGAVRSINVVPVSGGKPRVLVRFDDPTRPWRGWGFEAYGGRFYVTLGDLQSELWVANLQWKR
jgi:TolB protein